MTVVTSLASRLGSLGLYLTVDIHVRMECLANTIVGSEGKVLVANTIS